MEIHSSKRVGQSRILKRLKSDRFGMEISLVCVRVRGREELKSDRFGMEILKRLKKRKKNVKIVKIRPFRYGNIRNVEIYRSLKG